MDDNHRPFVGSGAILRRFIVKGVKPWLYLSIPFDAYVINRLFAPLAACVGWSHNVTFRS